MSRQGKLELERATETEKRRRAREEVDESKPPVDASNTPWPGWTMRAYFMSDGGEIKHYIPPRMAAPPATTTATPPKEAPGAKASASSGDGGSDGEEGDEVEKIVEKRAADGTSSSTAAGQPEYKVRWKGYGYVYNESATYNHA